MPPPDVAPASFGRKRERNAAATQQRLLDAAETEFARSGFAGARLREIADAAGVQPALIHHYFVDKRGLYRAVIDRAVGDTSDQSWKVLSSQRDLVGLVTAFVDVLVEFYAAHQNVLAIFRHESLSEGSVLVEVTRERSLPVIQALLRVIDDRKNAGEIRADLDADELILAAMALVAYPFAERGMVETLLPRAAGIDDETLARRKRTIVGILLRGIVPA